MKAFYLDSLSTSMREYKCINCSEFYGSLPTILTPSI